MHGDPLVMLRNFARKFAFLPDGGNPCTHIDMVIVSQGDRPCKTSRKAWLRSVLRVIIAHNEMLAAEVGQFLVRFSDLFGEDTSYHTYHAMVSHVGLTPRWREVRGFLMDYIQAQPSRSSPLFAVDGGT
jgi:hypothetical protein